jgi:polyhydroxyalkanoate synthesis regulator phasin
MATGVFETMTKGGSCLCIKFDFLIGSIEEIFSGEDKTLYADLLEVIRAAKADGQNMEDALKRKNEKIEELQKKLEVAEKELHNNTNSLIMKLEEQSCSLQNELYRVNKELEGT